MKFIKYLLIIIIAIVLGLNWGYFLILKEMEKENDEILEYCKASNSKLWPVQSIDTMKYSRDTAREKMYDSSFDKVIDKQVGDIANTGATHVAIGTPYDDEFVLFLSRWVEAARRHDLKVWFRGNLSGWEQWFDYEPISRIEHIVGIREFIMNNPDLFEDGDIFSSCPECENGGPGDPRDTRDLDAYRKFLVNESQVASESFDKIGRDVEVNFFSMNGDVARLIMNPKTVADLGGYVTIDHYVGSTEHLVEDVKRYISDSGGSVVLGEFGAPIPDIHGEQTEEDQAEWIDNLLGKLIYQEDLYGLNYWVNVGGSTALWNDDGSARQAVEILSAYYNPEVVCGRVLDEGGMPIKNVKLIVLGKEYYSDDRGFYTVLVPRDRGSKMVFEKDDYNSFESDILANVVLEKIEKNIFDRILIFFKKSTSFLLH